MISETHGLPPIFRENSVFLPVLTQTTPNGSPKSVPLGAPKEGEPEWRRDGRAKADIHPVIPSERHQPVACARLDAGTADRADGPDGQPFPLCRRAGKLQTAATLADLAGATGSASGMNTDKDDS